ncbi:RicAFT regulatory complex protein RicA family protein [Jeotgalibacillus marinus]|uniref:RicAFT regulatory complex protein RicA family protein n=1 Tax=Jeotgalibacillus marinus TaxID=86667 RepID=A0ABV3Q2Q1_9BACL
MEQRYTKKEIIAKAKDLATMITETEEVDFFKRAEAQIQENQKIREKMASLRSLQKQAVNFQHYGKHEALKMIEAKIEKVEAEINDIPIVQEFKQSQVEVNELLQMVANTVSNAVTDEIIRQTGGDILKGETGAQVRKGGSRSCS